MKSVMSLGLYAMKTWQRCCQGKWLAAISIGWKKLVTMSQPHIKSCKETCCLIGRAPGISLMADSQFLGLLSTVYIYIVNLVSCWSRAKSLIFSWLNPSNSENIKNRSEWSSIAFYYLLHSNLSSWSRAVLDPELTLMVYYNYASVGISI